MSSVLVWVLFLIGAFFFGWALEAMRRKTGALWILPKLISWCGSMVCSVAVIAMLLPASCTGPSSGSDCTTDYDGKGAYTDCR